jgi:hypothetical protein
MERQKGVNRHHLFYTERFFRKEKLMYQLRQQPGLIIPINIYDHRDLHQQIRSSTPKPEHEAAAHFISDVLLPFDPSHRLQGIDQAIAFFNLTNNELTAEHLMHQREFLARTALNGDALALPYERQYEPTEMGCRVDLVSPDLAA